MLFDNGQIILSEAIKGYTYFLLYLFYNLSRIEALFDLTRVLPGRWSGRWKFCLGYSGRAHCTISEQVMIVELAQLSCFTWFSSSLTP